jgi:hypothetical protein
LSFEGPFLCIDWFTAHAVAAGWAFFILQPVFAQKQTPYEVKTTFNVSFVVNTRKSTSGQVKNYAKGKNSI